MERRKAKKREKESFIFQFLRLVCLNPPSAFFRLPLVVPLYFYKCDHHSSICFEFKVSEIDLHGCPASFEFFMIV